MLNKTSLLLAICLLAAVSVVRSATVTFDCAKVPNICSNDCYAIQCKGKPTTLHRDSENSSLHRTQNACKSPNRCSGNPDDSNSCDEYPFASSQEGGAGAVTRCVPAHENSVQGGTLSSFYSANSIVNGDAYTVAFTSTAGLQYCSSSCTNTGNELIRKDDHLQSRPNFTQYNRREFLTDEGHVITMFERVTEPRSLDSLIGTKTWLAHEEREVTIVASKD
ncbi:hypothetical protein IE53DRAFT_321165 [Violaceomyces palustris]|uniref:Uncharacterized protein n=1 Tax=Violaceomyces palustris TaxID=1673888 RepID=A0ACD0NNS3_9BASI|nr:hypothetical protein IE53DRAFT_321165 [Violaceomyces palustris]